MFCACPDFPVLFSYYSSTKCSTSTMATRRDPDRKWWHVHAQPVPALFSYYSSVQNVFEKIRENVLRMPEFFPYIFFGFTRFFLIIVVVQTFFEKIRENVLRMAAFFPVLFLLPFFGFPRFFLTIIIVQKTWLQEVTEGVSLEGCAHAQPEVAQYPRDWGLSPQMTSSNVTWPRMGSLGSVTCQPELCNIRLTRAFSPEVSLGVSSGTSACYK